MISIEIVHAIKQCIRYGEYYDTGNASTFKGY